MPDITTMSSRETLDAIHTFKSLLDSSLSNGQIRDAIHYQQLLFQAENHLESLESLKRGFKRAVSFTVHIDVQDNGTASFTITGSSGSTTAVSSGRALPSIDSVFDRIADFCFQELQEPASC